MAAATDRGFAVVTLDGMSGNENDDGRVRLAVGRELNIGSFGTNAFRSLEGGKLINEHDETGFSMGQSDQEELYVVVQGRATFNVDGERVEAPAGSLVFVRDPAVKRSAVAEEPGTTVLAIGGKPGEAFFTLPEEAAEAFEAYTAKDYEKSIEIYERMVGGDFPNQSGILFNIACNEALLGRTDSAIEHLRAAIQADSRVLELIRTDTDVDSLRDDPRFAELIA